MALVGFEQDPSAPDGTGMFHFDDRPPLYARDPVTAEDLKRRQPEQPSPELVAAAQRGPDQRTASNGFQTTDQRLAGGGPAPGVDAALAGLPSFNKVPAPAAPAPAAPPPAATGGGPPPAAQAQGPDVQGDAMKFITAPVRVGATKGGYRPVKESQSVETEGLPYDPALAEQRGDAAVNLQIAHMAGAKAQADRALAEQAHWQAQLPEAQKRAAAAQTEMASQQDAYKRERADLDRMIAESQENQKSFNANRWMESKGLIGQVGAVIAQAFGAYAATLSHGENWAKKIIDDAINRDIESQKAQIESGKAGVTNALQKLNLRYGDMNQAQAALKMAMQQNVDAQIQTYAAATKSEDVKNTANEWLAQNQKDRVTEEQKFMAAAMGKRKTDTSGQILQASAGGSRAPTTAEMSQRAELAGKIPGIAEKSYDAELKRQKAYGGGNDEDTQKEVALLTSRIHEAKIPEARAALDRLERMIGPYEDTAGNDIPGVGPLKKHVPDALLSSEGQRNRAALERDLLALAHATGRVNPAEVAMVKEAAIGNGSKEHIKAFVDAERENLRNLEANARATVGKKASDVYEQRGGISPRTYAPTTEREVDQ